MAPRTGVLTYETTNAVLGWLLVAVLAVAAVERATAGAWLWTFGAVLTIALALVPPLVHRRPTEMLAWEVLALAAIPVVATIFGAFGETVRYLPVPALALVLAVELDAFTDVDMTADFAVGSVVLVTMAVAGVWVIVRYVSDVYLGTSILTDQTAVMWDLVIATGIGVVAGVAFELYFRRLSPGHRRAREAWRESGRPSRGGESSETLRESEGESAPADGAHRPFALAARVVQLAIVGMVAYGGATGQFGVVVNGVLSLCVTFVPALLERRYDHEFDSRLGLWIAVAAAVHVAGFFGPYDAQSGLLAWYDQVAHAISGAFVAGVGYALVEALDRGSDRIDFPVEFRFAFTLVFILAFGVLWEIGEFAGGAAGTAVAGQEVLVQYGITDIVSDLTFNTLAAVLVALWGTRYFEDVAAIFRSRLSRRDSP